MFYKVEFNCFKPFSIIKEKRFSERYKISTESKTLFKTIVQSFRHYTRNINKTKILSFHNSKENLIAI